MKLRLAKIIISSAIIFHLIGVLFIPNSISYTGQQIQKIIVPYMYHLGLSGAWSFFAPEPFSPPMYLDYVVSRPNREEFAGRFPKEKDDFFFRARQNRRVSIARFMMQNTANVEFMFVNKICHEHEDATSVKVWAVRGTQPDWDAVRNSGKRFSKTVDYLSEFLGNFTCQEKNS